MRVLVLAALAALVVAVPARAHAAGAAPVLKLAAEDATIVSVIDVASARDAPTLKTVIDATGGGDLLTVLADLGLDLADIDRVMAAGTSDHMIAVLEGNLTETVKQAMKTGTRKKHRGVKYFESGEWAGAMIDRRLVVAKIEDIEAVIDRHKKKAPSAARSAKATAIREAVAMTDTRHHVWLATTDDPSGQLGGLEGFSIAATAGSDLALELRGRFADEQRAADLVALIGTQLDQVRVALDQFGLPSFAQSLQLDRTDRVVELDAVLPEAEINVLINLIRQF